MVGPRDEVREFFRDGDFPCVKGLKIIEESLAFGFSGREVARSSFY